MWHVALALAAICLLVSIITGALGYKEYSGKSAYLSVVFMVIFVVSFGLSKTMEFFGY